MQTTFLCSLVSFASGYYEKYQVTISIDGDAWSLAEGVRETTFTKGARITADKILLTYQHPQHTFIAFTYAIDRNSLAIEQLETHRGTTVGVRSSGACQLVPFTPLKKQ